MQVGIMIALLMVLSMASAGGGVGINPDRPLSGIWVDGLRGIVKTRDGRWYLQPDQAHLRPTLQFGAELEILPSGILDELDSQPSADQGLDCMVWGQLEVYKARQYLFVTMWRWLKEPNTPATELAEPNASDPLAIPAQVAKALQGYQRLQATQGGSTQIQAVVDEVGRLVYSSQDVYLVTRPLGIDARARVYHLVPCSTLEAMELAQLRYADPLTFNVSGLLVQARGRSYLLPLRAVRQWGYGNLGL